MNILLDKEEIVALTGFEWPSKQLQQLHLAGFWRARIGKSGAVLLERSHYEAVASGAAAEAKRPKVRPPQLRRVA